MYIKLKMYGWFKLISKDCRSTYLQFFLYAII